MTRRELVLPPRRGLRVAGIVVAIGLAAVAAEATPPLVLINETPSVARGLYVRSPAAKPRLGALVTVAQPAAARPYLAGLGVPPEMRLLKRVAAVGGESVCARSGRLVTPRATVVAPRRDRRGARLPAWQGCRRLQVDEVLLLGDTAASFDGRYFGPVRRADLEATYREVLTW